MKKEEKIMKVLIPVIAVVVIAESLVLITNLTRGTSTTSKSTPVATESSNTPTTVVSSEQPVFNIVTMADKTSLKVGEKATVTVYAVNKNDYSLDAINLYLKADTKNLTLSNLAFDQKMPKPSFSKISTLKDLVVVNYMISEPAGLKVIKNTSMILAKFDVTAKKVGTYVFEVSTSNDSKESATMFVENATSKVLPYSSSKLTVNVVNK